MSLKVRKATIETMFPNRLLGGSKKLCTVSINVPLPLRWARHTMSTFRWKLVQIAGRIVHHAGRVILKLAVDDEKFKLFQRIRQDCYDLSLAP